MNLSLGGAGGGVGDLRFGNCLNIRRLRTTYLSVHTARVLSKIEQSPEIQRSRDFFFVPHRGKIADFARLALGQIVGLCSRAKKSNKTGFYSLFVSVLRSFQKGLMSYLYIKIQSDEDSKKIDVQPDVLRQSIFVIGSAMLNVLYARAKKELSHRTKDKNTYKKQLFNLG